MGTSSIVTIKGPNYFMCETFPWVDLKEFDSAKDLINYFKMIISFS